MKDCEKLEASGKSRLPDGAEENRLPDEAEENRLPDGAEENQLPDEAEESQLILKLAVSIGETLLKSGGEIYRVQETVERVLEAYGVRDYHVFVVSNGIFATMHEERRDRGSMVRYIPLGGVHLNRIEKLNQLSREIWFHRYTPKEAFRKLEECKSVECVGLWKRILSSGMGCAAFCYLYGGRLQEAGMAFLLGMLLQTFVSTANKRKASKFIVNIIGSAMVTSISLLLIQFGFQFMQDKVIIGGIMILVPGVVLTTGIRELFAGDYLSGSIHLMDAFLTATCIAVGVGAAIKVFQLFGGIIG